MKHIKLISILSLFVLGTSLFFIFAKSPIDNKPETIQLRVFEQFEGKKVAWVDYGNSKIEETKLDGAYHEKDVISSSSKILAIIQKLNSEGYKVISQSESYNGRIDLETETWVLTLK